MSMEAFGDRVWSLRATWSERRMVRQNTLNHDFASQFDALLTLYRWALEAVAEIVRVCGDQVPVLITGAPMPGTPEQCFSVIIGTGQTMTANLSESKPGSGQWRVQVMVNEAQATPIPLRPSRRLGFWTRRGLEDALLTLLTAYERDQENHRTPWNA